MSHQSTVTIPALPCGPFDDTLAFWQSLGFEVAYKQRAPNPYAVIRYADYELHLFGLKQLKPEENYSTCLVLVNEVEDLHRTYAERLRQSLGKVPGRGFPHITRMKPGQTRFTLVDNAGNSVIFIKRGDQDAEAAEAYKQAGQTPLQRALSTAARLRDFKNDDAAAAKVLDSALAQHDDGAPLERARVVLARIELAMALDEAERTRELQAQFQAIPLSEADRAALQVEAGVINKPDA